MGYLYTLGFKTWLGGICTAVLYNIGEASAKTASGNPYKPGQNNEKNWLQTK